ncbi:MAG: fructokinase [Candidatus Contendobacter odensis]|uniref:Fructokinase n=1 Tax=Candidatus Contendibacter odensensis TaxID=1400860 RepID=A0A2G6PDU5_9GAMM|nr:MAG: fructokinase [Candidatus Contendobacter odensis]
MPHTSTEHRHAAVRIGIDLGGTKIEIMALDTNGTIRARRRVPTPRHDYKATLQALKELVIAVEAELQCTASVGIGTPGTLSPATGQIKNANSTWLNNKPLDRDLEILLNRPLRFANDADCFTLSEACDGAAAGAAIVFGVILGTGVGGGIVIHGQVLHGSNGIAGEWGHNPLPWTEDDERPGPACYCGQHGCIETWLSGAGLVRDYQQQGGEASDATAIAAAAGKGDRIAEKSLERYEKRLARALASVINVLDPTAVVLGGGLSQLSRLYQAVPALWDQYVFSDRVDTQLLPPQHGDSSGVRGAAWLWP